MQMGSVDITKKCSKQWAVSIFTVHVQRHDLPWLKKTFNLEQKRGKWMICGNSESSIKVMLLSNWGKSLVEAPQAWFVSRGTLQNHSNTRFHWVRATFWTRWNRAQCFVAFSVISNFQNLWKNNFHNYRQFSRIKTYADKILDLYCMNMLRRKVNVPTAANDNFYLWANQWNYHYTLATISLGAGNRMHKNLSLCWVHSCGMFSKTFCNPLSMLVVKKTRIPTPVLLPKLWHWLQTARIAITLWIAVAIQLQSIRMMKRHMHRLTKNVTVFGHIKDQFFRVELAKSENDQKEPIIVGFLILH